MAHCRVSFTDSDGVVHTVGVDASSVYEAVALAVVEFRSDTLSEPLSTLTEFTISIPRPVVGRPWSIESDWERWPSGPKEVATVRQDS
jgi:hypothetical protein